METKDQRREILFTAPQAQAAVISIGIRMIRISFESHAGA
jgi:hypothetical protein